MGTETMGWIEVRARLENEYDLDCHRRGTIPATEIRFVDISSAAVDFNHYKLGLPRTLVEQLGVSHSRRLSHSAEGCCPIDRLGGVRLTILDRDFLCDIDELDDDMPVTIGSIPLMGLDLVVDPVGRRLIGNPAHGGVAMYEEY
jgi:hypothetical protein